MMKVETLDLSLLQEAPWNPNVMDQAMHSRLKQSVNTFGLVASPVVRPLDARTYEVLSGNQRLQVLVELGYTTAHCVIVDLDDVHARLLSQVLNRIHGEDDFGLRAQLLREVLENVSQETVVDLLPETAESLQGLASLGQETIAEYL